VRVRGRGLSAVQFILEFFNQIVVQVPVLRQRMQYNPIAGSGICKDAPLNPLTGRRASPAIGVSTAPVPKSFIPISKKLHEIRVHVERFQSRALLPLEAHCTGTGKQGPLQEILGFRQYISVQMAYADELWQAYPRSSRNCRLFQFYNGKRRELVSLFNELEEKIIDNSQRLVFVKRAGRTAVHKGCAPASST